MLTSGTTTAPPTPQPQRPDPTLREFLIECLYPACMSIARWIARRYGLRIIDKP